MANPVSVLYVWVILLTVNQCTVQSKNISLHEVAGLIIGEHISKLTSSIVITEQSITAESGSKNIRLLEYIIRHLDDRLAVQFYMGDYVHQPLEYYLFIVDNLESFRKIYNMFTDNFYERQFRFLIILTQPSLQLREDMERIFELCLYYNVIDASILVESPTNGVLLYTYTLYTENVCGSCVPYLLFDFSKGFENFEHVFPVKLRNLYGCPLKISARLSPPFFSFIGNYSDPKPIGSWDNIWGIEGFLIKILAHYMNFTIDLQPFVKEASHVKDNNTYGSFHKLMDHKVDVVIGGFIDAIPYRYMFSPTVAHYNSQLKYVIRGKKYVSSLARLATPYSSELWHVMAGIVCGMVVLKLVLRLFKPKMYGFIFGKEYRNPVTNFLSFLLGYSIRQTPRRNFARFIWINLLLSTLILRNAYQGSLYDAFYKDLFAKIPSGYNDLMKWNYTILVGPLTIEKIDFPNKNIIKVKSYNDRSRLNLLERMEGRYVTHIIVDSFLEYLEKNLRNGSELILLHEVVYTYQFVMFLSKHSIFLNRFNENIKLLDAAGLLQKTTVNNTMRKKIFRKYFNKNSNKIPLANKRLKALYVIWSSMLAVAVLLFVLEIISVRLRKLHDIFDRIIPL